MVQSSEGVVRSEGLSQFTFHKSANLKNNTNIHPYLRGPWMYYVGMLVMTSAEHRFIE